MQPTDVVDPFEVFGLEVVYDLEAPALRKRLLSLSRRMHPDFFGDASAEERELAERNTAELNAAHRVLSDDVQRANLLVGRQGGPDEEAERQMPKAFLMEVLEWNETLEEARGSAPGSPERAKLDSLETELGQQRDATLARVAKLLTPLPDPASPILTDARRELNAIRYLDRALNTLSELRLDQARSTS